MIYRIAAAAIYAQHAVIATRRNIFIRLQTAASTSTLRTLLHAPCRYMHEFWAPDPPNLRA